MEVNRRNRASFRVLNVPITVSSLDGAIEEISHRVRERRGNTLVHFTTVHMLVESVLSKEFAEMLRRADFNFPDGMPLVWLGRRAKKGKVARVCGPEFMPAFCKQTAHLDYRHFFYGGAPGAAEAVIAALQRETPYLEVAGYYCPPFRPLSPEEDREVCAQINASRADLVWVSLGCPRQEQWIADHRGKLDAPVLLAVGAAFDFTAGRAKRAPKFFREHGLEWLHRLVQDPRRLWRRYLVYNALFLYLLLKQQHAEPAHCELEEETRAA
jgi:N-acetylglucosaminyldiphosphoundecaprenol N-acetyl-beta-D-mannosaminyltransferase